MIWRIINRLATLYILATIHQIQLIMKRIFPLISLFVLLFLGSLGAQPPKFKSILYGAAFYEEYMPSDRLEKDVTLMQEAGITVVRLGESTWSLFEPKEGEFQFSWMDRIIDRLHKANIKVILGTPTYSIPAWLWQKHPEILVQYEKGGRAYYGIRQNMDITNPSFLFYAERIIRKMMEHYAKHPAIIGFQVDNETTSYGVNNPDFFAGFKNYLRSKFSLSDLNRNWGLNYWGMNINTWEELPTRDGVTNPGYKLEWERFKRKAVADYLTWQSDIVRQYKRDDQFVTHCFMPSVQDVDQISSSRSMDVMAINVYHGSQDHLTGDEIAFAGNYFRSVKGTNYLITETNAQTQSWDSKNQFPPYDGQSRQNVYAHLGSGANMVEYWHWHSLHYGQETYWKGVLSHDLEPNRMYAEVKRTAQELNRFGEKLVNLKIKNRVGILYSHDSNFGINFMPFNDNVNSYTRDFVHQFNRVLYRNNVGCDFIFPERADFKQYDLILIPPLYIAPDSLLHKISAYVRDGGHVILCLKSGFANEYSAVRAELAPGPLREACGFTYQEFTNIRGLKLLGDPFKVGDGNNQVSDWAELVMPTTAKALAFYDHPYWGKYPAVTSNQFGKGELIYEGTRVSDQIQEKLLIDQLKEIGLSSPDQNIHWPLVTKFGKNDQGKTIRYYYNYSSQAVDFQYPYGKAVELVSGSTVQTGQKLSVEPWGVLILEY